MRQKKVQSTAADNTAADNTAADNTAADNTAADNTAADNTAADNTAAEPSMPPKKSNPTETKQLKRIRAVKDPMYHPFQNRWIGVEVEGIEAILDSWIECQFEAGYLEEVVVE